MAPGPGLPASLALCRPRARASPDHRAPECPVPGTVLLLLAYLAYLALGTCVFWVLERPAARDSSARFQRDKWALLQNFTCLDGPALDSLIRGIVQAYQNGDIVLGNTTSMGRWEFMGSFFFSVSTVTTIGYGNLSPRTMAARLFCIFFALVGIPLNLVVLNRLGHLMQRGMHRCARRLGGARQDPTKARWLAGAGALLSGLLLFLLLPPLLFCHMEGWSYVESFYFAFITLSTVGFGDYVIGERALQAAGAVAWALNCEAAPCLLCLLAPAMHQAPWGLAGPKSRGHGPWPVQPTLSCDGAKVQLKSDTWSLTLGLELAVSDTPGPLDKHWKCPRLNYCYELSPS
ncbi:potassium channel subfamily K member 17 isoform X1 [Ursus arctos]|uniref:potassium channel subfamily K member 17 isoform X1 n=1 Tax=Ursus arctos TaxID=9644 RepID=UPI001CF92C49|nr:potassium channel subfamily K member 17 isoform X1 [Ursus arctos]